jgi:hypothetical protein
MAPLSVQVFRCQRMHVEGDEHYPIIPPMQCMSVQIANTTERDLRVEADSQGVEYFVLSAGDERLIQLTQPGRSSGRDRSTSTSARKGQGR